MSEKKEKLTKAEVLETVGYRSDPDQVKNWTYKVYSPNYAELPTVYLTDLDEAYGYYYLYIMWTSKRDCPSGTRFCLEERNGNMVDTGSFC